MALATLRTMTTLRRYRHIVEAGLLIIAVRVGLRIMSLSRLLTWLHARMSPRAPDLITVEQLAYYTDRWLTMFPYNAKGSCFPRALTLYRLARHHGFPVRFHCGVAKTGETLDGHAWLTLAGKPFLEPANQWQHFTVTFSFPPLSEAQASIANRDSHLLLRR